MPLAVFLQHRSLEPIRIIKPLQGGLPPHTQLAFVDRVKRVALYFDDASLPAFSQNTATRGAFPAGRGIPGRLAGYHVIRGLNLRKYFFLGGIAAKCEGNAAHTGNFEKGAPIHIKKGLLDKELKR